MLIMDSLKKIVLSKFFLFVVLLVIAFGFSYLISGSFIPANDSNNLWFYSGLLMVLISSFFIEEYYTSPRNILANQLPLIVIMIAVRGIFNENDDLWLWWIGFIYVLIIVSISALSIILSDEDKSQDNLRNRLSMILKDIAVTFGKGKFAFSAMFLYFLLTYYEINDIKVLGLMIFWWILIVTEPHKLVTSIKTKEYVPKKAIGHILSVQSKRIFLAKVFRDFLTCKKTDIVKFKYTMQGSSETICYGFVLDTYILNDQKWIKVLLIKEEKEDKIKKVNLERDILYKIENDTNIEEIIPRFVGVIIKGTDIGKIVFECYNTSSIQEGDLLELSVDGRTIYYQIIEGETDEEVLDKKNETGFIKGKAIQLGTWNQTDSSFEKFGWVPEVNSIVLKAKTDHITVPEIKYPEYPLGIIPKTSLPVILNLKDSVSHHLAILGVTGSGKSFITHEIIKALLTDTKVICVDFTGEYITKLKDLDPKPILHDKAGLATIEELIAQKEDEARKSRDKGSALILDLKKKISGQLNTYIEEFLKSDGKVGIFELPDLSNTSFILEFTQFFFEDIFLYAKKNIGGPQICLVLEEAHTIVPETTFLGDLGDYGSTKAIVNKIGQIALQGRKYGIGLIVIAQRTANVSKTVLTQCNTTICFQAFDETSFTFLGNYVGKNLVTALPNLPKYHAIVSGKGAKSNIPVIVDLTRTTKD